MDNPYYETGPSRSAKVADLFRAIAHRYDSLNDLQSLGLHRVWKQKMVRVASIQFGERALDLCCGTGDITDRLAKAGAVVLGLDFSDAMLAQARRRFLEVSAGAENRVGPGQSQAKARLAFCRGDAQQLPFADGTFDVVTIAYGLRNLADWGRGLEEMWRVTRAGGRVVILDFGRPANAIWRGVYFGYLRGVVPWLGRLFSGDADAYSYILESLRRYPAQAGVGEKLLELSGKPAVLINLMGGAMSIHAAWKEVGTS